MGEIGRWQWPVPGVRAVATRASIWRVNLAQAALASWGSRVARPRSLGLGPRLPEIASPGSHAPALPFPGVSLVLYTAEGPREGGVGVPRWVSQQQDPRKGV